MLKSSDDNDFMCKVPQFFLFREWCCQTCNPGCSVSDSSTPTEPGKRQMACEPGFPYLSLLHKLYFLTYCLVSIESCLPWEILGKEVTLLVRWIVCQTKIKRQGQESNRRSIPICFDLICLQAFPAIVLLHVQPSPASPFQCKRKANSSPDFWKISFPVHLMTYSHSFLIILLCIVHDLGILFTLFPSSATHISFCSSLSLFFILFLHYYIWKWDVNQADFSLDHREFVFSYCLDRVLIYADQEQTTGNLFWPLPPLLFLKSSFSTRGALHLWVAVHILQSLHRALNLR